MRHAAGIVVFGVACALHAACARGAPTRVELPPLEGARALVVAASDAADSLPRAMALDPTQGTPELPTVDDNAAEAGVFTVLAYTLPLPMLRLEPGPLALEAPGPDIAPLPEPQRAYERTSEADTGWSPRSDLAQTALRASRAGIRLPCPRFEVTWVPIDGVSRYVQAATWVDDTTLLVATDTSRLVRVDTTRDRAVTLEAPLVLIGGLFTTREGRVFAATGSTAPIMEVLLDGDTARLAPLPGLRVDPPEGMASLIGPPPGAPEPEDVLYALARTGRLVHATLTPPATRALDVLGQVSDTRGGGEFVWLGPRRYVGFSNRALGRVFTLVDDVVSSRLVARGAFGALLAHPTLGAIFFDGVVPRAQLPGEIELRSLPPLPTELGTIEAVVATPWGFVASGFAGRVSAYLTKENSTCAVTQLASVPITRLVALPDGDLLAFSSDEPTTGWPTSWGRVQARFR